MKLIVLSFLLIATIVFAGRKTDRFIAKSHDLVDKLKRSQKTIIFDELKEIEFQGGDYLGYSKFITSYLKEWHKIQGSRNYPYRYRNRWRREKINPLDLFSGGIAIRESLQIDSISKSVKEGRNTVKISTLESETPKIKSHPFKEMLGNKEYKYSEISKLAPNDFYYIHIPDFAKSLNLWEDLMLKVKSLYKRFETGNIDYSLKNKLMLQLGLKENKALRSFYHLVIKEAAIVGSDPFIVTGSDVTMIFNVKNIILFAGRITHYREEIKKENKAIERNIKIMGYEVNYIYTKDRKVNSYFLSLDKRYFLISNSLEALKKVIKTYKKPELSLFEADEYKYMRSIYKLNKDEGIFLYMSDPFIRKLVSAEIRLKEARRVTTQFKLVKLQSLLLLYHQLYKKDPKSLQQMILKLAPNENSKEHYKYFMKFAKDLKLSKDKKSVKSVLYGDLGYFRPNIDNYRFKLVTDNEANSYKKFVANYNNYWKDYFDPIGIRISTKNNKITIDTHILPLINSSMYNRVKEIIGGKAIKLNKGNLPDEWLKVSFKITDFVKNMLPKAYDELNRELRIRNANYIDLSEIIGDYITFSILDSSPMVDFSIQGLFSEMLSSRRIGSMGMISIMLSSLAHPIRITIPLKNNINLLKKEIDLKISYLIRLFNTREMSVTSYKEVYKSQEYTILTFKFWETVTFRVYFAFTENSLEVTSTERYLKYIIDMNAQNQTIVSKSGNKSDIRNISISFHPNAIKLEKEYFNNTIIDNLIKNNLKNIRTLTILKSIYGKELNKDDFYNRFGFNIINPLNKAYTYSNNTISHLVLSGYDIKKINSEILQKEILNKYYKIRNAEIEFEFTDTGIDARVTIE